MITESALLALLRLTSPALPIGAFAWSQGLEYAVEAGWIGDEAQTGEWLQGLLRRSLGRLDLPALAALHRSAEAGDAAALAQWNARLLAGRETAELYAEDIHLGGALRRLLDDLNMAPPTTWPATETAYATGFAMAAVAQGVDRRRCLLGYTWAWLENQVTAAIKLVPLGQTAGQRVLSRLLPMVPEIVADAERLPIESIGSACPAQAMASALHEGQYARLFRS